MKKILVGADVLMVLGAFLSACKFPLFGSGVDDPATASGSANTDGAETILIPGGTFWMGSEENAALAGDDEMPYHEVNLGGFYIYTHEVTNAMYAQCVTAGACIPIDVRESGPSSFYDDPAYADHPVVGVDWNMASDYCAWAHARLPTEAEWELAARGTESRIYPWEGTEAPACERVNMNGCQVPPDTLGVGSLALGNSVYEAWDMSGNVWEWVHDWYDEDYYALSPQDDPLGPYFGELKVVRGGSYQSETVNMRTAARVGGNPLRSYDDVGFRCVVADLALPEGYVEPLDTHAWMPAYGSNPCTFLGCPDTNDLYKVGPAVANCPDSEGHLHVLIGLVMSTPLPVTGMVNGSPFDCSHDEAASLLECEGLLPADDALLDFYTVEITLLGVGARTFTPDRPDGCSSDINPFQVRADAGCAAGGMITIHIQSTPSIVWGVHQLDGADIPCSPDGESQLNCNVLERLPGDHYEIYLKGTDAEGSIYTSNLLVMVPDGCPSEMQDLRVTTLCFKDDHPAVQISAFPLTAAVESASAGGTGMACMPTAPGVYTCGDLPGAPGDEATVTICLGDGTCHDVAVTVPDCPAGRTGFTYTIDLACDPAAGYAVIIDYDPADQPLISAEADGNLLTCTEAATGVYNCTGFSGSPGDTPTVGFCLQDGSCYDQSITVPDCSSSNQLAATPGSSQQVTAEDWRIKAAGCYPRNTAMIDFIVDTGLDWLIPGASFTYTAGDDQKSYTCSANPTPGDLYCYGPRPGDPGTLKVCIQQAGAPAQTCQSFDNWPSYVLLTLQCSTPSGGSGGPGQPGGSTLPACNTYSQSACPAPRCYVNPASGECDEDVPQLPSCSTYSSWNCPEPQCMLIFVPAPECVDPSWQPTDTCSIITIEDECYAAGCSWHWSIEEGYKCIP